MGRATIYDAAPWLERSWSAMAGPSAGVLQASVEWYGRQLAGVTGSVCELACGYGRLLLPLAQRGLRIHGTDASSARVAAAREVFGAEAPGADATFEVLRMPAVPRGRTFDAVILALNAIGYVCAADDKIHLLRDIASIVKPGGLLVMDQRRGSVFLRLLRRWPGLRGSLAGEAAGRLSSHLAWDASANAIRETFVLRADGGEPRTFHDHFRFCPVSTTFRLLRSTGFRVERCDGAFDGRPYRPWSRMIAIVAQRDHDDA